MSDIVRTNKEINIASGDFAKKLREALGQDEPRGGEIALRREFEGGVATTITFQPGSYEANAIKEAVANKGSFLTPEQIAEFAKNR